MCFLYNDSELHMGRGGGQMFSTLAFYSENTSLNPAEVFSLIIPTM